MALRPQWPNALLNWRRLTRNEHVVLSVLAVVIGCLAAYGAIAFRALIGLVQEATFGTASERLLSAAANIAWWQLLLGPVFGGLVIGLFVQFVMPGGRNRGVADVIEAGALHDGRMPFIAGIGAALASAASIGFGASVGREGPVVHLGATIAAWLANRLKFGRSAALTLLGCGVAAAVASSFNAPIAGVFFALEVVVGHYALSAFAPVVIASVIGTIVTRAHLGDFPAFIVPDFGIVSFLEFPAFVLLGLISAAVAGVFMWSVMYTEDTMKRLPVPMWSRPMLGGLAVGLIALAFPEVLGVGYEATDMALHQELSLQLLIALILAKTVATVISLGSGFAGGVFSPSLFIGAMLGGAFGLVAASVFPDLAAPHGAYTIVGMGAVAAAVLGAPVSTILIIFELTGNYSITMAVMVACAVSSLVVSQIPGKSFFLWQLGRRGVDIKPDRGAGLLRRLTVRDAMTETVRRIPQSMKLGEIRELLRVDPGGMYLVVDDDGRFMGGLGFDDISDIAFDRGLDDLIVAFDIAQHGDAAVLADDSLESALALMTERGTFRLAVIDDTDNRNVLGAIKYRYIMLAHNRALMADQD